MMVDAIITVKGMQYIDDQSDTIEFSTEGRFGEKNGDFLISYEEGEMLENSEKIKTVIYLKSDNSVILERKGGLNSRMVIENGKRNSCIYGMAQGQFVINIVGEKIEYSLNDNGGNVELKYLIDSNMKLLSKNTVNINIRTLNQEE